MQVKLFDLPCIISLIGFRRLHRVRRQRETFLRGIRHHLVLRMAVLAVLRVGDHYVGLIFPVQFVHPVQHLLLSAGFLVGILRLPGFGIPVRKGAELRIGPHAHGPEPVQRFAPARRVAAAQVGDLHVLPQFRAVIRDRPSGKQQFVVRMGYQHQQVRLSGRFLPPLYPVRDLSLSESEDLVESHHVFLAHGGNDPDLLQPVQLEKDMMIPAVCICCNRSPSVAAFLLDREGVRHLLKAEIQSVNGLVGRDDHPWIAPFAAFPEGGILPVRDALGLAGFVHHLHGQAGRQVLSLLRAGRNDQQKQEQDQQERQHRFQLVHVFQFLRVNF